MRYHTEVIPFKDYVKGVLPNEWLPKWELEALKAGAVAVKQFGLVDYYQSGYVWDCNWDQVYDPTRRTEITDKAVDDTWDLWLIDSNYQVVKTYYNADKYGCLTQSGDCMSQYESQRLAKQGNLLRFIILKNYKGTLISVYNYSIWPDLKEPDRTLTRLKSWRISEH